MDRISILCTYLSKCNTFADVGCDHGYIAEYMLKNNLCNSAQITDVSQPSLQKAITLLSDYIGQGRCRPICCDGLEKVDANTDFVVIAGMGGEEIIKILKNGFIPKNFLFQPMKNADALREFLLREKCSLSVDDVFFDGYKHYFLIKGANDKKGSIENYTKGMLAFGKHSLKNAILKSYLNGEIRKIEEYLSSVMTDESRASLTSKLNFLKEIRQECN